MQLFVACAAMRRNCSILVGASSFLFRLSYFLIPRPGAADTGVGLGGARSSESALLIVAPTICSPASRTSRHSATQRRSRPRSPSPETLYEPWTLIADGGPVLPFCGLAAGLPGIHLISHSHFGAGDDAEAVRVRLVGRLRHLGVVRRQFRARRRAKLAGEMLL